MMHFHFNLRDRQFLKSNEKLLQKFIDDKECKFLLADEMYDDNREVILDMDRKEPVGLLHITTSSNELNIREIKTADIQCRDRLLNEAIKIGIRRGCTKITCQTEEPRFLLKHLFRPTKVEWIRNIDLTFRDELDRESFKRHLNISANYDCTCDCEELQARRAMSAFGSEMVLSVFMGDRMVAFAVVSHWGKKIVVWAFYVFPSARKLGVATFFIRHCQKELVGHELLFVVCCPCECSCFYQKRGFVKTDLTIPADLVKKFGIKDFCVYSRFINIPRKLSLWSNKSSALSDVKFLGEFTIKTIEASGVELRRYDTADSFAEWIKSKQDATVDILFLDSTLVGYAVYLPSKDADSEEYKISTVWDHMYLAELFVHPGWQNMGIGEFFLSRVCVDKKYVTLHVENDNYSAQKFYHKQGFDFTNTKHINRHSEMRSNSNVKSSLVVVAASKLPILSF